MKVDASTWEELYPGLLANSPAAWETIWPAVERECIEPFIRQYRHLPRLDSSFANERAYRGLVEACRDWDPAKGANFRNFVHQCVRRELLSGLTLERADRHNGLFYGRSFNASGCEQADDEAAPAAWIHDKTDWVEELCDRLASRNVLAAMAREMTNIQRRSLLLLLLSHLTPRKVVTICRRAGIDYKSFDNGITGVHRRLKKSPHWHALREELSA